MPETLSIVLSIFGLIGLGYAAARIGLLARSTADGLTEFVFKVAIPLLLFDTIARADLGDVPPWRIWTAYFVPFAIVWAGAHVMVRRVFGRDARAAVVGGGSAAYSNAVLIGIPLIQAAFGEDGTLFLIVIVSVHLPVMMLVSVVLNEWALGSSGVERVAEPWRTVVQRLLASLATHPILLAIVAGLLWRATGLPIPEMAARVIEPLSRSAGPLALFASGMALLNYGVGRQIVPAVAIAVLKLLVLPALVYVAASAIGLLPLGVAVLTLTAACPTGVNAFLIASRLGTGEALASNALLLSSAGGVVTVAMWLAFLRTGLS